MKKGISNFIGVLFMGTALLAVPSCTDTWDEHYGSNESNAATKTLWELMEEKDELSSFRSIVSKAKFFRDERHPAYTMNGTDTVYYTFKDILSGNSSMTVFAPVNDALTPEEWARYEAMAQNEPYNLQQQFVSNHIALYRKSMSKTTPESETIRMINNKFATLYYNECKIQDSKIIEANIGATNGLLHVIEKEHEYFFNLYEFIKYSGRVKTFRDYLVKRDTVIFNPGNSIEGLPDANGNPTYVERDEREDNLMFYRSSYNPTTNDANDEWMNNVKMFNAQIHQEDSAFVMIIPTDKAWKEASERLSKYYTYADAYPKMNKLNSAPEATYLLTMDKAKPAFPNGKGYGTVDSLQTVNIEMDMIYPLVFNARTQKGNGGVVWTAKQFVENYMNCKYLLTTTGDTIRDVYKEVDGVKQKVWEMASLFQDGVVEIKEMSNGYAIITDKWNFSEDYFMRDIDIEASPWNIYKNVNTSTSLYDKEMNNNVAAEWIDEYGRCSEQRYLHVKNSSESAKNEITFVLNGSKYGQAEIMATKYDIYVVMVPTWYNLSTETPEIPKKKVQNKLTFTLYYWDTDTKTTAASKGYGYANQKKFQLKKDYKYENEMVKTILLYEDFEFPVAYRNVRNSYPILEILSNVSAADRRQGFTNEFCIDRIILKAKE
jgi:hypothetical protein